MSISDSHDTPSWAIPSSSTAPATSTYPSAADVTPADPTVDTGSGGSGDGSSRRLLMVAAGAAGAVALAVGGFLAATAFDDASGSTTTAQGTAFQQNGRQGQAGQQGPLGEAPGGGVQGGPGGGVDSATMTAGRITAVFGTGFTLQAFDGAVVTVTTTSSTTTDATVAVGQVVFLTGTRGSGDTFAATRITSRPQRGDGDGPPAGFDPDGDHQGVAPGQGTQQQGTQPQTTQQQNGVTT